MLIENTFKTDFNKFRQIYSNTSNAMILQRAIRELTEAQLPNGELPLYTSYNKAMVDAKYTKTVFLTAFQSALHCNINNPEIQEINQKSCAFLKNERSSNGLWRFFGKGSEIDPDIDDTFAALCALRNDKDVMDSLPKILYSIEKMKSRNGLYYTWFREKDNSVDLTVNANILLYMIYLKVEQNLILDLLDNILKVLKSGCYNFSKYYLSDYTFVHTLNSSMRNLGIKQQLQSTFPNKTPWFIQNRQQRYFDSNLIEHVFLLNSNY